MKVSVVLCTYSSERYNDFSEAADSLLAQTYDNTELVVVVDGNEAVHDLVLEDYGDLDTVQVHCNDQNRGLLESRNRGAELATGDIVAFIDDDAVADERWIEELVSTYESTDVEAAGGKMTPIWVAEKPSYLPEEFYWLVGVTHRGFGDAGEVRNTFGSNISFERDVFLELGGFNAQIGGRKGDRNLQGGETELAARLREEFGGTVYYNPDAEVGHKVFEYRTDVTWLLRRAFWQGYSKRAMEVLVPGSSDEESTFLRSLLTEFVPSRVRNLPETRYQGLLQLSFLVTLTGTVGLGYLYGIWKWR